MMIDQNQLLNWLANGERGTSSDTLFTHLTGITAIRGYQSHPLDLDDFRRCELLLRQVPGLREKLHHARQISPVWARLVQHWDEIVNTLESEIPGYFKGATGKAQKTYALMESLIRKQEANHD